MTKLKMMGLHPEEWELVHKLRAIPESPLRDLLTDLIHDLAEYARQPGCAELQADGIPCGSPDADCEDCKRVRDLIHVVRGELVDAG